MFRIQTPEVLYLLILIPLFVFLYILYIRKKKRKLYSFIDKGLCETIIPELSFGKHWLKFILILIAYFFLVVAIANPQIGTSLEKSQRKGSDLMICLDISNSMYAEDIKPNRISRAKQALNRLVDQLNGDRIGIVVFAGSSFVQLPITNDYGAAKTFIDIIDPSMIVNQGTVIGQALKMAEESFGEEVNDKSKSIILISDGEDNDQEAIVTAKDIAKKGIVINTIGLGLKEGALIPITTNAGKKDYKKTSDGSYVMTRINEELLQDIAKVGNGKYLRANNASIGLDNILARINKMEKNEYNAVIYKEYESRFYIFAFIALLILVIDYLVFERKNKYINRKFFFGR